LRKIKLCSFAFFATLREIKKLCDFAPFRALRETKNLCKSVKSARKKWNITLEK
jgi:hypothetical protein